MNQSKKILLLTAPILMALLTMPAATHAQYCTTGCTPDSCLSCPPSTACYTTQNCAAVLGGSATTPPPTAKPTPTVPKGSLDTSLPNPLIDSNGKSITSVPQLINTIIVGILGLVGAVALLMFVYGGVLWMTSLGNDQRVTKGKETLTWATIGLVIIFASYAILTTIFNAFK